LSDGTHTVTASETDVAGNTGTTSTTIVNTPVVSTLTITGLAQEGQTLMASVTPGESDDTVNYQWSTGGNAITGATGATFVAREVDEGNQLSVTATVASADDTATASASAYTGTVLDALPTIGTPTISGTAREGQTLTASGALAGQSDNPVTWQWQQDGANISGATGSTYLVQEGDENHTLDVVATATNDDGITASATSAATASVVDNSSLSLALSVVALRVLGNSL
jgi:hypothetical protein